MVVSVAVVVGIDGSIGVVVKINGDVNNVSVVVGNFVLVVSKKEGKHLSKICGL